jgi:hypothetical protein
MKFLLFTLLYVGFAVADDKFPSVTQRDNSSSERLLSRRGDLVPIQEVYDLEQLNNILFDAVTSQKNELKKVKFYLINGETGLATAYLMKLAYTQTKLRPIIFRYLAILSFIEGKFYKTDEYLQLPELQNIPHFGKICVLKVVTDLVLDKKKQLQSDWARCQIDNTQNVKQLNLIWLETLVQLKLNPKPGITQIPFKSMRLSFLGNDETKILLKLALFLNQEDLIKEDIWELKKEQLADPEIRELAGQILFRTGSLAKAYRFIEDLKSPNAENIKGNLYLLRKKYEVAYAQFKVAIELKQNSQNAMERLLPLAWILGDWDGGAKYAEQVIASPQSLINKMTLMAAFFMQKGDYAKTSSVLSSISLTSRRGSDIEVAQIASFTALMQNKTDLARKNAQISCEQYDMISCWLLFQLTQWDNFSHVLRREDDLKDKREWEMLTGDMTHAQIKETVFINQLDIEELDDKLLQLIPKQ